MVLAVRPTIKLRYWPGWVSYLTLAGVDEFGAFYGGASIA